MYTQWMHRMWMPLCVLGLVLSMGSVCCAEPGGETPFAVPDAKMLQNTPEPRATPEQLPTEPNSPVELNHLKSAVQMPPVPALSDPRTPLPDPSETESDPVRGSTERAEVDTARTEAAPTISAPQTTPAASGGDTIPAGLRAVAEQGGLTVRAMRAFGRLQQEDDTLALSLRGYGVALWAADSNQIENWLQDANLSAQLTSAEQERLQGLAAAMRAVHAGGSTASPQPGRPHVGSPENMSDWTVTKAVFEASARQITAEPGADRATSYYVAPPEMLGDWTKATALVLEKKSSGGSYYMDGYGYDGDIVLQGPKGSARYRLEEDHTGQWREYRVPLDGSGWEFSEGAQSLAAILEQVTGLQIRAEYGLGEDTSALRGVMLVGAPSP